MEERSIPEKLSNMKSVGKVFYKGWAGVCSIACWKIKEFIKFYALKYISSILEIILEFIIAFILLNSVFFKI